MNENFEKTTRIVNGYWYTFEYHNAKETVPGYDRFPMIYCIGPSTKNLNVFEALNLHHLPLSARIEFMVSYQGEPVVTVCNIIDLSNHYK